MHVSLGSQIGYVPKPEIKAWNVMHGILAVAEVHTEEPGLF